VRQRLIDAAPLDDGQGSFVELGIRESGSYVVSLVILGHEMYGVPVQSVVLNCMFTNEGSDDARELFNKLRCATEDEAWKSTVRIVAKAGISISSS